MIKQKIIEVIQGETGITLPPFILTEDSTTETWATQEDHQTSQNNMKNPSFFTLENFKTHIRKHSKIKSQKEILLAEDGFAFIADQLISLFDDVQEQLTSTPVMTTPPTIPSPLSPNSTISYHANFLPSTSVSSFCASPPQTFTSNNFQSHGNNDNVHPSSIQDNYVPINNSLSHEKYKVITQKVILYVFDKDYLIDPTKYNDALTSGLAYRPIDEPIPRISSNSVSYNRNSLREAIKVFGEIFELIDIITKRSMAHENLYTEFSKRIRNQNHAMKSARLNLKNYSSQVCDQFDHIHPFIQMELEKQLVLLQNIDKDITLLHYIPLSIKQPEMGLLADHVPIDKIKSWADNCKQAYDRFSVKYASILEELELIRQDTIALEEGTTTLLTGGGTVIGESGNHSNLIQRLDTQINDASLDLRSIRTLYERAKRDKQRIDGWKQERPDMVQALTQLISIYQKEYLPNLFKREEKLGRLVEQLHGTIIHFQQQQFELLKSIAVKQKKYASLSDGSAKLTEALEIQMKAFSQLRHVHRMAPAWGAAIVETARRHEFDRVQQFSAAMNQIRELELKRRENFKQEIIPYLPQPLMQGFDTNPWNFIASLDLAETRLPYHSKDDVLELHQTLRSLSSQLEASGMVPSMNNAPNADGMQKLDAIVSQMTQQIDYIGAEFEKICKESGFLNRFQKVEDDNTELRSRKRSLSRVSQKRSASRQSSKMSFEEKTDDEVEETLRSYENRIHELERLLQDQYSQQPLMIPVTIRKEEDEQVQKQQSSYLEPQYQESIIHNQGEIASKIYSSSSDGMTSTDTDEKMLLIEKADTIQTELDKLKAEYDQCLFKRNQDAQNVNYLKDCLDKYSTICTTIGRILSSDDPITFENIKDDQMVSKYGNQLISLLRRRLAVLIPLKSDVSCLTENTAYHDMYSSMLHDNIHEDIHLQLLITFSDCLEDWVAICEFALDQLKINKWRLDKERFSEMQSFDGQTNDEQNNELREAWIKYKNKTVEWREKGFESIHEIRTSLDTLVRLALMSLNV